MPTTKISREEILSRAWALFHQKGYSATSLADVAAAAGLGKAGILHHFGSKEGLMQAVIAWARGQYQAYVLSVFTKTGTRSDGAAWTLEARLAEVLKRQYHLAQLNDGGGCFFGNSILENGIAGPFAEALQAFYVDWQEAATAALSERFEREEAAERAYRLFAEYQGSILLFKMSGERSHLDRFKQRAIVGLSIDLGLESSVGGTNASNTSATSTSATGTSATGTSATGTTAMNAKSDASKSVEETARTSSIQAFSA